MDSAWAYGIVPKSEPGLESLSEWLSGALRRHKGTRVGIWGGCIGGTSGIAGGAMGAIASAHAAWWAYTIPWAIWLVWVGIVSAWLIRSLRSDENGELWGRDSSRVITMLVNARARGKLRTAVGDASAAHLNDGAKLSLRCRGILDSTAMRQAATSSVWSGAAERVRNAMDAGMLRLLMLATQHGEEAEMLETLAEMRALVDELAAAERRHATTLSAVGARRDALRSTLQELKELSKAEDEVLAELSQR